MTVVVLVYLRHFLDSRLETYKLDEMKIYAPTHTLSVKSRAINLVTLTTEPVGK